MSFNLELLAIVIAFLVGLLLISVVVKVFFIPLKYLMRLIVNGIIGGILLLLFNYFGGFVGLYLPINVVTALIAGFLGIPGVILLVLLDFLIL